MNEINNSFESVWQLTVLQFFSFDCLVDFWNHWILIPEVNFVTFLFLKENTNTYGSKWITMETLLKRNPASKINIRCKNLFLRWCRINSFKQNWKDGKNLLSSEVVWQVWFCSVYQDLSIVISISLSSLPFHCWSFIDIVIYSFIKCFLYTQIHVLYIYMHLLCVASNRNICVN